MNTEIPHQDCKVGEYSCKKFSFMDVWNHAWYWMDKWDIPLEAWQKQRINLLNYEEEPTSESLAYYIANHCENLREDVIPEKFKPLIRDYMIHMMTMWNWPEWGYKKVKHLKPKGETK